LVCLWVDTLQYMATLFGSTIGSLLAAEALFFLFGIVDIDCCYRR
jgi:hypothetical protein